MYQDSNIDSDSSGGGMTGGSGDKGEPKIKYVNPLTSNIREHGFTNYLPENWIFIGIPMNSVNKFCEEHINKDNEEPHTINEVANKKKSMDGAFQFFSNLILINPAVNGSVGEDHVPKTISNIIILPPNICLHLKGENVCLPIILGRIRTLLYGKNLNIG